MTESLKAPRPESFPQYPASWYLFCHSRDLARGPLTRRLLGRDLVAFRTASGRLAILDAHCSHLGADLGRGRVTGEAIQCPFHNWSYGTDGRCVAIPCASEIPSAARQRAYPVQERHGYVFFFNGRALFPLPFFFGADPDAFAAGRTFRYLADCTWYMNAAHAFDTQHFAAVHDRELLAPPEVDCPAPFARRNRYRARVLGLTRLDRMLKIGAGRSVEISITTWGGTFVLVTGDFTRARSRFIIATTPQEDGTTVCEGIVFAPRSRSQVARAVFDPFSLSVRRLFTFGYLADETRRLRGTQYRPQSLGPLDRDMIEFFQWVVALPQDAEDEAALLPREELPVALAPVAAGLT
jgi:phenylpropionate dioxygenase-like ring-hydroxylating dioxygenase large terminal subunit